MRRAVGIALALLVWVGTGCRREEPIPQVRLRVPTSSTTSLPAASPTEPGNGGKVPLRVAIAAVVSPRASFHLYDELLHYLGEQIGVPIQRLHRSSYAEVNNLLRDAQADVGFICTLAYTLGHDEFGLELLAAPVVNGSQTYRSLLIVRADGPIAQLEDLRGKTFAFTDPLSNSGRLAALTLFLRRGWVPARFFRRTIYTYSHDRSIDAVTHRLVDAAAVDSLVYEAILRDRPEYRTQIRVLWESEPFPTPPVVVHPALSAERKAALRQALLNLHRTERGRRILGQLGIDRFAPIQDAAYDSIRAMYRTVATLGNLP